MGNPLSKDSSSPRSWASTSPNSSRNVAGSGNKRKSRRRTFGILTTTPSNIFKKNLQKYPFSILLMPSTSNAGKPDISHKSSNQSLSTQQRIMELERCDAQQETVRELFGRIYNVDFDQPPRSILEIAAGNGVWCLEMAKLFPQAQITGVDNHQISTCSATQDRDQSQEIPTNCHFSQLDVLNGSHFPMPYFDFVYQRFLSTHITRMRWEPHLQAIFQMLHPGGWVELVESPGQLLSIGRLGAAANRWIQDGMASLNFESNLREQLPLWVEEVGFEQISVTFVEAPLGYWADGLDHQEMGTLNRRTSGGNMASSGVAASTGVAANNNKSQHQYSLSMSPSLASSYPSAEHQQPSIQQQHNITTNYKVAGYLGLRDWMDVLKEVRELVDEVRLYSELEWTQWKEEWLDEVELRKTRWEVMVITAKKPCNLMGE